MSAIAHIEIEQGTTYNSAFIWLDDAGLPVDITGATAEMKIKESYYSPTALLTLSTESDPATLVVDGPAGKITPDVSPETTAALDFSLARYDLLITQTSGVQKLIKGWVRLRRTVTL